MGCKIGGRGKQRASLSPGNKMRIANYQRNALSPNLGQNITQAKALLIRYRIFFSRL